MSSDIDTSKRVRFTLDGRTVEAAEGELLLAVADREGVAVPTLCALDGIEPYGVCRLCTVRVSKGGWERFVTACNYPVWEGMEVETDSEPVLAVRRLVVEALWSRCPDVPVLKSLAKELGVSERRFPAGESGERCILCGRCANVCAEVVGAHAIGLVGRGAGRKVGTPFEAFPDACIGCGACAFVCPTRCISMEGEAVLRRKEQWGEDRPCRYALMGLTPGALCIHDYACRSCEVDQRMFDRAGGRHPVFLRVEEGRG